MRRYRSIQEFQDEYPSREAREEFVRTLTNDEIDELINLCDSIQGKNYYSRLKREAAREGGGMIFIFP